MISLLNNDNTGIYLQIRVDCTGSRTLAVRLREKVIQELISASRSESACRNQLLLVAGEQ